MSDKVCLLKPILEYQLGLIQAIVKLRVWKNVGIWIKTGLNLAFGLGLRLGLGFKLVFLTRRAPILYQ
jgi:hypothetical protein